ncbi:hypothetical protein N8703_01055 [Verrucomicrobia bacterium]|nr:hypothetical protein [Verrucomicrobiota bacterium]
MERWKPCGNHRLPSGLFFNPPVLKPNIPFVGIPKQWASSNHSPGRLRQQDREGIMICLIFLTLVLGFCAASGFVADNPENRDALGKHSIADHM